ncbi:MAG: carbon monoxide dehydrogenase subunit G [Defluviicoccus sp.]|nr:carbon monoxide dehydrogenase subunit G [Defluviicoccus sp.]MDE0276404.1 carbon monoxide dehydrogenase subunit G [Defluviicoccus sp.]
MEMTGERRIPASRQQVWDALNDPEILKQCIAGCESLDKTSDTEFSAKVTSRVGPVTAKFTGKVELSDVDPPNGYTISGEGQGGVAGFAKGGAKVQLADDGDGTLLTYEANGTVGGKLAQIGSRLIDSTARKMADDFFDKFAEAVGGAEEEAAAEEPAEAPAAPPKSEGLSPAVWIGGLVAIAVIVLVIVLS